MSGSISQFASALRDVLGACRTTSLVYSGALATQAVIGPAEVYSIDFLASAAGVGVFQLVDASATGIGGTVIWQTTAIPTSFVHEFTRPLAFTKGLNISYTATAAVIHAANVSWSPRNTNA